MKTIITPILATVAFFAGCSSNVMRGDGRAAQENRTIADFTSIDATGGFDILWSGGEPKLSIATDENLLSHIKTEVSGGKLKIYPDDSIQPTKGIKIVVSSGALKKVNLTGAIHLAANQITEEAFGITTSGAVRIDVSGSVKELTAALTGACQLQAGELAAGTVIITLTGASNADVAVKDHLKATIAGAGSLTYSGNPSSVEKNVAGVGTIQHRQ